MKKFLNILGIVLALSIVATSCEKAPFLTLSTPKTINFTDQGGTQSITFTANRDWSVSSSDSWCKVSPSSGIKADGNITVTLTCEPNTTYDPRSATLTVRVEELSETITVTQDTNLGLLVSPTSYDLTNAAQLIEVEVRPNVKYTVEIDAACKDWISQTGTKALSTEKITFSIAANESYDNREGKITIKQTDGSLSETIVVKQSQTDGLFITTPEYNLSNDGHTLSVEVNANVSFDVTSEVSWIHYVETKALTSSTITLTIDANDTYDARTGKVSVKQSNGNLTGEITVNQAEKYGLFVSPEEFSLTKEEQTINVEVKYNVEYDVVIPDAAKDWVSIQTSQSTKGLTTKTITFAIAENKAYVSRETAIAFKQKDGDLTGTVKISQDQTDYLSITPQKDSLIYQGGISGFSVITNIEYSIALVQGSEWASIGEKTTKGTNDGLTTFEYSISAPENETIVARYAIVNVNNTSEETLQSFILAQGPQPIIEFADKYVALVCKEKFDKNNDGEISLLEAKRLTDNDLSLVSNDFWGSYKNLIKSFDEFKYFTSITTIPSSFFSACTQFGSIILPESVRTIDAWAFHSSGIRSIDVSNITSIGDSAFSGCEKLEIVNNTTSIEYLGNNVFEGCNTLRSFSIPSSIKQIGSAAFRYTKLSSATIPESSIIVPNSIFQFSALQQIDLPETLLGIDSYAFSNCSQLAEIRIPNNVEYIGEQAFIGNSNLQKVYSLARVAPSIPIHLKTLQRLQPYLYLMDASMHIWNGSRISEVVLKRCSHTP